jgi:GNAT superfamily N-acetyltransferase
VDQDYRRKGIGRMLFNYLVDFAKNFGANVLELDVWEFNKEAFRFYEEMGMETVTRKMERKLQSR